MVLFLLAYKELGFISVFSQAKSVFIVSLNPSLPCPRTLCSSTPTPAVVPGLCSPPPLLTPHGLQSGVIYMPILTTELHTHTDI